MIARARWKKGDRCPDDIFGVLLGRRSKRYVLLSFVMPVFVPPR